MSTTQPTTESIGQAVAQSAVTTAEQLLPVLLAGLSAGSAAATPQGAMIAMVAEILPPLIQSFGANSGQIAQLLTALSAQIKVGQAAIDAAAAARGITDPTAP